jgi:geranylgeranyl pyrophosphate synthase
MVIGAKLAQVKEETLRAIEKYADNFGILFQVYDDIIDCTLSTDELGKTAGKDADVNKLTYVKAFGLQEAKNIYNSLKLENYDILTKLNIKLNVFDEIYQLLDKRIN